MIAFIVETWDGCIPGGMMANLITAEPFLAGTVSLRLIGRPWRIRKEKKQFNDLHPAENNGDSVDGCGRFLLLALSV